MPRESHVTAFRHRLQRSKETLTEYAFDLQRLAVQVFPDCPEDAAQRLVVSQFIEGLRDANTQIMVQLSRPRTLDEALQTALEIDVRLNATKPVGSRGLFLVDEGTATANDQRKRRGRRNRRTDSGSQSGNDLPSTLAGQR